ncbi:SRPBCC family protein [Georgenia deserti]|uniref:SRPBCC family protein n=1 Tax=Georgenia deserti TaxID=2093781 RepID=A0ABW4L502_9MICO
MSTHPLHLDVPEGLPFIDFTREFDAPVAAVFRAHADPELVRQWLGPRGYEMTVEQFDFRSGGTYRYTHVDPDGNAYGFRGSLHTVRENELAIQTFEFDGAPDVVSIETLRFVDLGDGRTRLEGHSVYPSVEARDAMAQSGMETGMSQGYERLEEVLADRRTTRV